MKVERQSDALHTDDYKVKSSPNAKAPLRYRSLRHRSEATIIANGADATNTYDTACPTDFPTTEVEEDKADVERKKLLHCSTSVPEGANKTQQSPESEWFRGIAMSVR